MRQRGFAWLPLLLSALPYIAGLLLAWGAWRAVDGWCNRACQEATAQRDELQIAADAARERATALALLWASEIDKVKVIYKEVASERKETFAGLRERAGKITASGCVIRTADELRQLLADATAAANRSPVTGSGEQKPAPVPGPAGEPEGIDAREIAQKWAEAAEAYREADDGRLACVAAYNAVRDAVNNQPEE